MTTLAERVSAHIRANKLPYSTSTPVVEYEPDDGMPWKHWRHTGEVTMIINGRRYHAYCAGNLPKAWGEVLAQVAKDLGVDMPDSTQDTLDHIHKVQARLQEVCNRLAIRAAHHDESKLHEPEKSILDAKANVLATLRYGTPEYAAAMASIDMQPFLQHHYAHNSHHPQYYENGIAGMSLLDIIEMLCDWAAAGERTKEGSLAQSLEHNRGRFGIDDQLLSVLENTVRELGW